MNQKMNGTNLHTLERDSYKEVLRLIKDQSIMLAHAKQRTQPSTNNRRKLTHDHDKKQELNLPSIESSTLRDISQHFHTISKHKVGRAPQLEELAISKTQLKYIQESFQELESSKMSMTVREMNRSHRLFHGVQRKVPQREPQSVKYLEVKLGCSRPNLPPSFHQKNRSEHAEDEVSFPLPQLFEETVNTYSYAVPSRRESGTLAICRERLYLFGGMSGAGLTNEVWFFDFKKQEWSAIQTETDFLRTGHSMVVYKNFLVIYGGSGYYDHKMKIREVYSTLGWFNTQSNEWTISLESIEPRREHKAIVYGGKYMVVVGGLDAAESLLNDTAFYALDQRKWVWPKVMLEEGIAQHALCLGYDYKHSQETVYLFGGRTRSLGSFPLKRLVFNGTQPACWEDVPLIGGPRPQGRYNHTMENVNDYLILIGGRSQEDPEYQNEVWVFNLFKCVWSSIRKDGLQTKRWSHASCLNGSQIMCFGGIGEQAYLPSHLYQIETDALKIRGKLVVIKKLSVIREESKKRTQFIAEDDGEESMIYREIQNRPCKLERFRNSKRRYEKVSTYFALPQLKHPKIRYDILIGFVKQVLRDISFS